MNPSLPSSVMITTSRTPTSTMRTFCNDLTHAIPNSKRFNRGKASVDALAVKMLENEVEKAVIAGRWKGHLGKLQLLTLEEAGFAQFYPIIYVKTIKLRRDIESVRTTAVQSLMLQTESKGPSEAYQLAKALANFFSIPCQSTREELRSNTDATIFISRDDSHRIQITFLQTPQKIEIGPRITVSHLIWKPRK